MAGPYYVIAPDGTELAGDRVLDDNMRDYADQHGAIIRDMAEGTQVWPLSELEEGS